MKALVVLALTVAIALGAPVDDEPRIDGENGWYVPQLDGTLEWMWEEDVALKMRDLMFQERSDTVIIYYLYTQSNPETPQIIEATEESIRNSNFNKDHPTRFIIHGWTSSYSDPINTEVRKAWLYRGEYNVISVDWSSKSKQDYSVSVMHVPIVGQMVAGFVDYLHTEFQMPLDNLVVIGHSLGAHIAGFTGKNVKTGQVDTIIGLDPAQSMFSYNIPSGRLASTDAFYVESIQTSTLGFQKPIGKGAFYPNGGKSQPGCGWDLFGSCAHSRSYYYYAEAVMFNDFATMRCLDYEMAIDKDCGTTYSSVRMGALTNAYMVAGDFYVPVNSQYPYGMGAENTSY